MAVYSPVLFSSVLVLVLFVFCFVFFIFFSKPTAILEKSYTLIQTLPLFSPLYLAGWEDQEDLEVIVINPEDFQGEDGGVEL